MTQVIQKIYHFLCTIIKNIAMAGIINYIWEHKLIQRPTTTEGKSVHIISCGNSGKDNGLYTDARIRIGEETLTGCVRLHDNGYEEYMEHDNVILNVATISNDKNSLFNGCRTPLLKIEIPEEMKKEFNCATQQTGNMQCMESINGISTLEQHAYMSRLLVERMEEKGIGIKKTLHECGERWNDTLFRTIVRSLGFGIQSNAFTLLANIIDIRALEKHRDNLLQLEAILLGQAGLLESDSIPYYYRATADKERYYSEITREFRFLRNKFNLQILDHSIWNGNYTPHVRIARVAQLFHLERLDISRMMQCESNAEYYSLLDCTLGGYWSNHICIGGAETSGNGGMSRRHLDIIIINAIIPIIYMWGKLHGEERECNKAEELLHRTNSEENRIVRQWKDHGAKIECAADSQAILQLDKRYCRMHRCSECRFAYYHIRERLHANG